MTVPDKITHPASFTNTLSSAASSHQDQSADSPSFTPAETPPIDNQATSLELLHRVASMDEAAIVDTGKVPSTDTKEEVKPQVTESKDEKAQPTAKKACKKHIPTKRKSKKSKRKSKKDVSSDSDSSSSSSSSSGSESAESSSESSSEDEDEDSKKRRRKKAKKLKAKKAALKKAKAKAKQKSPDDDESSSSDDSSSDEDEKRKARKKKAKAKAKKAAEAAEEAAEQAEEDDPVKAQLAAQLQALNLRQRLIGRRRTAIDNIPEKTSETKSKKKKADPKHPNYFRVDQLWDNTIHNYKLTETTAKADEDDFGESSCLSSICGHTQYMLILESS